MFRNQLAHLQIPRLCTTEQHRGVVCILQTKIYTSPDFKALDGVFSPTKMRTVAIFAYIEIAITNTQRGFAQE